MSCWQYAFGLIVYLSVSCVSQDDDPGGFFAPSSTSHPFNSISSPCGGNFTAIPKDEDCECVPFYQCDKNNNIIVDGSGIVEFRTKCTDIGEICCFLRLPADSVQEPQESFGKPPDDYFNECPPKATTLAPWIPPVEERTCGYQTPYVDFKTQAALDGIGNAAEVDTVFAEYPWMLIIYKVDENGLFMFVGGASLVHPKLVLTAAHLVKDFTLEPYKLVARAGEWDTKDETEPFKHQDRVVKNVIMHPNFSERPPRHDIAMLVVQEAYEFADHVNRICLPDIDQNVEGRRCIATGWGKRAFDTSFLEQSVLKKLDLPIINHEDCQNMFRRTRLGGRFILHQSFMCAGGEENVDTCEGDGGGPLFCAIDKDHYMQVGITSWGIGCGGKNIPGAYVKLSQYTKWINDYITDLDSDFDY